MKLSILFIERPGRHRVGEGWVTAVGGGGKQTVA